MPNTVIPGTSPCHKIITDACRAGRGDSGAADAALDDIRRCLLMNLMNIDAGQGFKFHVVFTIERPPPRPTEQFFCDLCKMLKPGASRGVIGDHRYCADCADEAKRLWAGEAGA